MKSTAYVPYGLEKRAAYSGAGSLLKRLEGRVWPGTGTHGDPQAGKTRTSPLAETFSFSKSPQGHPKFLGWLF